MARNFDGVDDFVSVASQSQVKADFTMCFWAFPESEGGAGAGRTIRLSPTAADTDITLHFLDTGINRPTFSVSFGTKVTQQGADNDWPLNIWNHWSIRFRASDNLKELLKNGVVLISNTTNPGTTTISGTLFLGVKNITGAEDFDGSIADFRWYDMRLSNEEIQMAMRGVNVRPDKLKLHWPLFGVQSPEPDWSGNNNHGTITGAIQADHPSGISAYWLAPNPKKFLITGLFTQVLLATQSVTATISKIATYSRTLSATVTALGSMTQRIGQLIIGAKTIVNLTTSRLMRKISDIFYVDL